MARTDVIYRLLFRLVLAHLDPERAHALAQRTLAAACSTPRGRALVRRLTGRIDPVLRVRALGLTFPSPVGVAAGLDKEATWFDGLTSLGFGFVEVGTITARPQEGNAPPRVARFARERALLNRMGFPNPGAREAATRLARRPPGEAIVGVNVGKSKVVPMSSAVDDYRAATRDLAPVADYLVLNISSPNTPGLRELQATDLLRVLLAGIRDELRQLDRPLPLLVKIGPDLDDEQLEAVAALALELELDGIVAVNTTVDRRSLRGRALPFEQGGVSGRPLAPRALAVLRRLRAVVGDRIVLISVGGVADADDVWARILAGATLVQTYTALIYEGPSWPRRVNRDLAAKVKEAGAATLGDLVGAGAESDDGPAPRAGLTSRRRPDPELGPEEA